MDKDALVSWRKAGEITARARQYGFKLIKPGVSLLEVADKVEEKIKSLGGLPAFPAQISLNATAAHYCPWPEDKTEFKEDLVKLDCGVHVNGFVGDTAITKDLTSNNEYQDLIKASSEALKNAIKVVKPGVNVSEIGEVIQETIQQYRFSPVKNLSGHAVGKFVVHGPPSIPNVPTGSATLAEDLVIAIEPFASSGAGMVREEGDASIFMLEGKKPVRSPITRKVLQEISTFQGLPFTTRWLTKKLSQPQVNFGLRELQKMGILHEYPPLVDKNKGMIAQTEHTVIVKDKPEVLTRDRD
jgi:methionyl aminopeptidase